MNAADMPGVRNLRVLFIHQSSDLYGSDRVLRDLVRALLAEGAEPIVVLPGGGPLVEVLRTDGAETHAVDAAQLLKLSRASTSPRGLARLLAGTRASLRALDQVVHGRRVHLVHSNTLAVLAGALWARSRGVRHAWHVHEIVEQPRPAAWLFPRLVRLTADEVVCNSHATLRWLTATQPALLRRSCVIWNGIESPAAANQAPDPALHALFRPAGTRLAIGLVGRVNRWKGHDVLLAAAQLLHERGVRDFSLVFVGSAPPGQEHLMDELRQRVAASPLARRVVLHGFVPDTLPAMRALDVICVPSTLPEPFGLVAVEAMAASRPVIASACGGLVEVLGDSTAGSLVAPGNAPALAECLRVLLGDAQQRGAMGRAGRARFESCFTGAAMSERFVSLVARACLQDTAQSARVHT